MATMCDHMGAATPGFSEVARRFHESADEIGEQARAQSVAGILQATATTVSVCTGCHATYKQRIVDEDEWRRLTGAAAPKPGAQP
jgi:cytochrome c556